MTRITVTQHPVTRLRNTGPHYVGVGSCCAPLRCTLGEERDQLPGPREAVQSIAAIFKRIEESLP